MVPTSATCPMLIPYSAFIPGTTKPRVAGFITSTTSATPRTKSRPQCAPVRGASSMVRKNIPVSGGCAAERDRLPAGMSP